MFFRIENNQCRAIALPDIQPGHSSVAFASPDEAHDLLERFGLPPRLMDNALSNRAMTYESHEGFDFVCVNMLKPKALTSPPDKICIYMTKELLLFAGPHADSVYKLMQDLFADASASISLERVLLIYFDRLTAGDTARLEDLEQDITDLENALLTTNKRNAVREIISLRQRLMAYKRHYEQLLSVLDMLEENDDNLLSRHGERTLRIFSNRTDRLYHSVLNLRDYVTQVRESYQAEVDISLNNIMKIFTVITAIFLPLTLLVGWYGMNLKMPEFQWSFAYPMVIILSIMVVIFCLVFFKKRKWF